VQTHTHTFAYGSHLHGWFAPVHVRYGLFSWLTRFVGFTRFTVPRLVTVVPVGSPVTLVYSSGCYWRVRLALPTHLPHTTLLVGSTLRFTFGLQFTHLCLHIWALVICGLVVWIRCCYLRCRHLQFPTHVWHLRVVAFHAHDVGSLPHAVTWLHWILCSVVRLVYVRFATATHTHTFFTHTHTHTVPLPLRHVGYYPAVCSCCLVRYACRLHTVTHHTTFVWLRGCTTTRVTFS